MKYFWINIDKSTDRKEFMENQFKKYNIENYRVSAITPDDFEDVLVHKPPFFCGNPECLAINAKNCKYEFACTCSHIKACVEALKHDDDYFMIIEDDIIIPFELDFDKIINELPFDADIFQMLVLYSPSINALYDKLYKNNIKYIKYQPILPSTGMYLISRRGAQRLINLYMNQDDKYDFSSFNSVKVADMILYSSVTTYVSTIPLCYPHIQLESEIHPDHINEHTKAINSITNILEKTENIYYRKN